MSKQTAVEWLTEKIETQRENGEVDLRTILHYCNQAKAMEKEQIMDAVNDSWNMAKHSNFADAQAEQYYNETYGGDK
jgi:hypothetical protein